MHAGRAGDDFLQLLHGGWTVQLAALRLIVARPVGLRSENPHVVIQLRWSKSPRTQPIWRSADRSITCRASLSIVSAKFPYRRSKANRPTCWASRSTTAADRGIRL